MTLLAKYESILERDIPAKQIRFSAVSSDISRHEEAFGDIIKVAFKLYEDGSWQTPSRLQLTELYPNTGRTDVESLIDAVFRPDIQSLPRRPVQMSVDIDVVMYDTYEATHPYYQSMMAKMTNVIESSEKRPDQQTRILELGAGTGIFTAVLLNIPNVHVTALEIDWACFHLLKQNIQRLKDALKRKGCSCELLNKDSRDTNPDGTFDFVVSSFADHHIHALDKRTYFQNVKRNLRASAVFVVGDEFLPEYDFADEAARRQALNTYHDHIVQQAQAAGHVELVELEEQARRSGLASKGDYKLSLGHYGKLLQEAGLKVRERTKIGPLDPEFEGVGGIYVYEITPS